MKHNKPKMKCRGRISESENESEDGKDDVDLSDKKLNKYAMTENWKQGKKRKHDTKKDTNMDEKQKIKTQIKSVMLWWRGIMVNLVG